MNPTSRTLPKRSTKPYLLLTLTALSGEFPAGQADRLGSPTYFESVVKSLKKAGLLRTYYKNGHRGYRLTLKAKELLLADQPARFSFFLTGSSETNHPKSEVTRRLRLHRIAESIVTMIGADVAIFRDEKPHVFFPEGASAPQALDMPAPAFYTSREIKEVGTELAQIRGARAVGVLLTTDRIFLTYNTGGAAEMKWEYKSKMRAKALMKTILCQHRLPSQYGPDAVQALLMGRDMEIVKQILMGQRTGNHNYFIFDGNYDHFYYIPNNHAGEIMLKLLCSEALSAELDGILRQNLMPRQAGGVIENDATDAQGDPVLFAYLLDLPRILRFDRALELQDRQGTVICFDFQAEVLRQFCCKNISFEVINLQKYERGILHQA